MSWTTDTRHEEAKECSWCKEKNYTIHIQPKIMDVIKELCETVDVEWQMLLKGTKDERGHLWIDGYYIPKQEVSASTVKNLDTITKEFIETNNIVATIHSHASMGVFFSNVDEECTNNSLIANHIVTNNNGDFLAVSRLTLPCGMMKYVKVRVMEVREVVTDIEGLENIDIKKWNPIKDAVLPNRAGIISPYGMPRQKQWEPLALQGGYGADTLDPDYLVDASYEEDLHFPWANTKEKSKKPNKGKKKRGRPSKRDKNIIIYD